MNNPLYRPEFSDSIPVPIDCVESHVSHFAEVIPRFCHEPNNRRNLRELLNTRGSPHSEIRPTCQFKSMFVDIGCIITKRSFDHPFEKEGFPC